MLVEMLTWGHDSTTIGISNLSDKNNIILNQNHDILKGMSFLICY